MKISVIGAGNVGSLTAMRLAQEEPGEVILVDIVKGLARGKVCDLQDSRPILKYDCRMEGTDDIARIKDSDIIVVTAGLARRPGMTREELLNKNTAILKDVSLSIKRLASDAVIIVVTNPLDLMTYYLLKATALKPNRVFGMGVNLDAARFANLIAEKMNVPIRGIESWVIGSHGEGMIPLSRFTKVDGTALSDLLNKDEILSLTDRCVGRGAEIVSLLGSGSAYFAPSAAITEIVLGIARNERRKIGVSAYLDGEYGIKGVCIGVPCWIGRKGIEEIIELDLDKNEKEALSACAESLRRLIQQLPC